MISINSVFHKLKNDLKNLGNNQKITIKCAKKDRCISIYKKDFNYIINEEGFKNKEYIFNDLNLVNKTIKSLIKYEFPNSSLLWYYCSK